MSFSWNPSCFVNSCLDYYESSISQLLFSNWSCAPATVFILNIYIYIKVLLFIFGSAGSLLLHVGFLWLGQAGATVVAHRFLTELAFLGAEHGLQTLGLQQLWLAGSVVTVRRHSCPVAMGSSWTRDRAVSPTLQGGFLTSGPPGKPWLRFLILVPCDPTNHPQSSSGYYEGLNLWCLNCTHVKNSATISRVAISKSKSRYRVCGQ